MSYQIQEINRRIQADPKEFVDACDAAYAEKIERAARAIAENVRTCPIVLLSGPSGSGKTTTAMKIAEALRGMGISSQSLAMDDYFRTVNPRTAPRTPEGDIDFESPACLDMDLLGKHLNALARGEEIHLPRYNFVTRVQSGPIGRPMRLGKDEVVVCEGIHALNDDIAAYCPDAFRLYISARSVVVDGDGQEIFKGTWMRLLRRLVRDSNFRGTPAAATLDMWANVRRGEKRFISPFKERANLMFDSSFPCEVSIMKNFAAPSTQPLHERVPQLQQPEAHDIAAVGLRDEAHIVVRERLHRLLRQSRRLRAQRREDDAPPVVPRARAERHAQGGVHPRREGERAVVARRVMLGAQRHAHRPLPRRRLRRAGDAVEVARDELLRRVDVRHALQLRLEIGQHRVAHLQLHGLLGVVVRDGDHVQPHEPGREQLAARLRPRAGQQRHAHGQQQRQLPRAQRAAGIGIDGERMGMHRMSAFL